MRRHTADLGRAVGLIVVAAVALTVAYRVPPAGDTRGGQQVRVTTAQHGPVCPAPKDYR